MREKIFLSLLIFVPAALIANYAGASAVWVFVLSGLAIVPLAKYIGQATEELANFTSSALGGVLNASFGNATELIIGIFALREGLIEVVKASITGSIIGNLLLVTGTAFLAGGIKYKTQKFNRTGALSSSGTLLLAAIALTMPAIFLLTAPRVAPAVIQNISVLVAIFMLVIYAASLFFTFNTHKHLFKELHTKHERAEWSLTKSIVVLALATLSVAWVSEVLVGAIKPLVLDLGWSELFIGVIFIAIIGNAAEHYTAITAALKNRLGLSMQISVGSATQIAMFVAPFLVLVSLFFQTQMSLVFKSFELIAILLAIFISNLVVEDGESNWFEGLQLLVAYAIFVVAFFFHP